MLSPRSTQGLVLKGGHSNATGTLGRVANSLPHAVPCIQRCTATPSMNNKPSSHSDYAHHEVLYHPSYPERLSTSHHIDSMLSRPFQQGCASQCLADDPSHLLVLQYLNLVTNQEKEFSASWIRVKTGQRRDGLIWLRPSAPAISQSTKCF
jgi:hypothetical protein